MSKSKVENVELPEAMVNFIRERPWFEHYSDFEDLVLEAVRQLIERKEQKSKIYVSFETYGLLQGLGFKAGLTPDEYANKLLTELMKRETE